MIQFTNVKQKYIAIALLFLLLLGVARMFYSIMNQRLQPKSPKLTSDYGNIDSSTVKVNFIGQSLNINPELNVYSFSIETSLEQYVESLVAHYNNNFSKTSNNRWQTPDKVETLSILDNFTQANYSFYDPKLAEETGIDPEKAEQTAFDFLQALGLDTTSMNLLGKVQFFGSNLEYSTVSQDRAAYAVFAFSPQVESYPLLLNDQDSQALQVWVRNDYRVTKATLVPIPTITGVVSREKTYSFETLLTKIREGQGSIIRLSNYESRAEVTINEFSRVELTEAHVAYRAITTVGKAYPYVVFNGKAEGEQGIYEIEILVSAI